MEIKHIEYFNLILNNNEVIKLMQNLLKNIKSSLRLKIF